MHNFYPRIKRMKVLKYGGLTPWYQTYPSLNKVRLIILWTIQWSYRDYEIPISDSTGFQPCKMYSSKKAYLGYISNNASTAFQQSVVRVSSHPKVSFTETLEIPVELFKIIFLKQ